MRSVGLQLYSIRDEVRSDRDAALRRVAALGFDSVEPFEPLTDPVGFRALADELGLSIPTTHGQFMREKRDEFADAAHILGADALVVPAVPATEFADSDAVARTVERVNETAAWAAENQLQLGYHNHWWEFISLPGGRYAFDALLDGVTADLFWEIDVYWATVAGVDVPAFLKRLGNRVRFLHVKDGPGRRGESP